MCGTSSQIKSILASNRKQTVLYSVGDKFCDMAILKHWVISVQTLDVGVQTHQLNLTEPKCIISPNFCQIQSAVGVMLQVMDEWTNHGKGCLTLSRAHAHTSTCTAVEELNRSSKSVISTTPARSEELLELLIELGMLEHTHTHIHAPTRVTHTHWYTNQHLSRS